MSKQTGISNSEDEVTKSHIKRKGGHHKRRGPWEVWTTKKYISPYRKKDFWEFMQRDYATKELAEAAAGKWIREGLYDKVEIRYNERKA